MTPAFVVRVTPAFERQLKKLSLFSAWATRPNIRSTGSTRIISPGKTCKALVVSILVPQERL